jgi:hypothetical protein
MPTRKQIADAIDARMETALPLLAAKQAEFRGRHGRYCQMLPGRRAAHYDTTSDVSVFDEFADKIESRLPLGIDVEISINIYETPDGQHGFELIMTLTDGAERWRRTWNVGPETRRGGGWLKVIAPATDP